MPPIALRVAVTRPDLVRALVLARPAWTTGHAPANMAPNALVGRLLARHPPDMARRLFQASPTAALLRRAAPDNLASLLGFFDRAPRQVTAALLQRISADGPGARPADLRRLRVPTLVIGQARDLVHPLCHARTLARHIPNTQLVEITPKAVSPQPYYDNFRIELTASW